MEGAAKGGFLAAARELLERIAATQDEALEAATRICVDAIGVGGLVHAFGTGHSRIPVESSSRATAPSPGSTPSSSSR